MPTTWTELQSLLSFYGALLKADIKRGLTLKNTETRESFQYFKKLLELKYRWLRLMQLNPHKYN